MKKMLFILIFLSLSASALHAVPKEIEEALKLNHINHFDEALGVIERALDAETIKPDITSAYTIGRILFRKGDFYREMGNLSVLTNVGYFLEMKQREKSLSDEVKVFLGIGHFFSRRYLEAAGILSQVAGSGKAGSELEDLARVYLGASYHKTGEKNKATDVWKSVRKENAFAYSSLGYMHAYLGINPSLGEGMAREALERGGKTKHADSLKLNHAYTLVVLGKFDEAYSETRGLKLDAPVYAYVKSGEREIRFYDLPSILNYSSVLFGEAIKNLEPIVSASSGELASFAAYYVAQMYLYLGSSEKSVKYVQKAKKLSVASSLTMVRATACEAVLEFLAGNDKRGLRILGGEAERIHGKPSMLLELIEVLVSSGVEYQRVGAFIGQAESFIGKTGWEKTRRDISLLGELAFYTGDETGAISYLEEARDKGNKNRIETNDPNFLLKLAYVYYTRGFYSESLEILFSLGRSYTGVRQIQYGVQSVYVYKQKGSGEAIIE